MDTYQKGMQVMQDQFAKDCTFSLATDASGAPAVRVVDLFFDNGSFYLVTYSESRKACEILENPNVAICSGLFRFTGQAVRIGHPLDPANSAIREKLIRVFHKWYFKHNNEDDPNMCYVRIDLSEGFVHADGVGYKIDFKNKAAETFEFVPDIIID